MIEPPEQPKPKGLLATIGNAIGAYVEPIIAKKLDALQVEFEKKLDDWFDKAMAALPEIGAKIAESAVKTVFDNTQIDEAVNDASGVVTDFFDNLRKGLPFGLGG